MKRMTSAAAEALTFGGFGDDSPSRDLNAGVVSGELSPQRKRKVFSDYASPRRKKKIKANDGPRKSSVRASSPGKGVGGSEDNSRGNGTHTEDLPPPRSGLSPRRMEDVSNLEDLTPPRRRKQLSPVHNLSPLRKRKDDGHADDLSPPRLKKASSPEEDLSPPRRRPVTVSPRRKKESTGAEDLSSGRRRRESMIVADLSPPRRKENNSALEDISPPRRRRDTGTAQNLSPARRRKERSTLEDLSPPRRIHGDGQFKDRRDFSPPRRNHGDGQFKDRRDFSPPRRVHDDGQFKDRKDISPPRRVHDDGQFKDRKDISPLRRGHDNAQFQDRRKFNRRDEHLGSRNLDRNEDGGDAKKKMLDGAASGLRTDKDIKVDIERKRNAELRGLAAMDVSQSGRGAETVYRDKRGKRLEGLEELLRQQEGVKKAEEKPLEWGKGLVQKREAETKQQELEAEASKPFARSRDDPDLDKSLRERVRWGDPMAHLVKAPEAELEDIGARENMKDSGFNIPQDMPTHSWIKRRIGPPPNRYGIKPGRHWDGVDRSNGFEQKMFKHQNEKRARDQEAYAWSVADM